MELSISKAVHSQVCSVNAVLSIPSLEIQCMCVCVCVCERGRMSHIQNFPLQSKFPEWKPFNVKLKWGEKVVLTLCPVSAMISNENHPLNRIKQHNLELIS